MDEDAMCDGSLFGDDDYDQNENGEHYGYGEHHADDEDEELEYDEPEEFKDEASSSEEDETPYGNDLTTPVETATECPFQSCTYVRGPKDAENAMTIHVETQHSILKCVWCNKRFYQNGSKDELQEHIIRQHKDMILSTLGATGEIASGRGAVVAVNGAAAEDELRYSSSEEIFENTTKHDKAPAAVANGTVQAQQDELRYSSSEEIIDNTSKPDKVAPAVATDTIQAQGSSASSKPQLDVSTTPEETRLDRKKLDEILGILSTTDKHAELDRGDGEDGTAHPQDAETAGQDLVPSANMFCSRCFRKVTESTDSGAVITDDMKFHTDPFRSCRVLDQLGTTEDLPNRSGWIRGRDMANRRELKQAFLKKYPGYAETMYPHLRSSLWKFDPNNEASKHVWNMPWPPVEDAEPAEKVIEESEIAKKTVEESKPSPVTSRSEAGPPDEQSEDGSKAPGEQQKSEPINHEMDTEDVPEPSAEEGQAEPNDAEEIKAAVEGPEVEEEQSKLRSQSPESSPQSLGDKKRKRGESETTPVSAPASPPTPETVDGELPSPKRQRRESNSPDESPSVEAANPEDAEVNAETDLAIVGYTSQDAASPAALESVSSAQAGEKADVSTPEPERKPSIAILSVPEEQPREVVGQKRKRINDELDAADAREESPVCIKIDENGFPRLVEVPPAPESVAKTENSVTITKVTQPEVVQPEVTQPGIVEPEIVEPEVAQTKEAETEETEIEETRIEETRIEETRIEETRIEETRIEEVKTEEVKTEEVQPEEVQPEEVQPEEVQPEEVQPEEVQPEEVQPEEVQPEEVQPEEKPKRKRRKRTPLPNAGERVLPWKLRDRKPAVRYT